MFKKTVKKLLIAHLKRRKGRFSGMISDPEMAALARAEMERIRVRHEVALDSADEFWRSSEARALDELIAPAGLEHFLRLKTIGETMFEYYAPMLVTEYRWLKRRFGRAEFKLNSLLQEDAAGDPIPFLLDSSTSGNLLHHVYHYLRYRDFAKEAFGSVRHITEFGGGYGSMCRVFLRGGFSGRYVIQDLKTFSVLQTYFLNSIGLAAQLRPECAPRNEAPVVECVTQYDIPEDVRLGEALFLATWSLSETGIEVRNAHLPLLDKSGYFLLAFRDTFEGVDNIAWFQAYMQRRSDVRWNLEPIEHIPNSYYLFGAPYG